MSMLPELFGYVIGGAAGTISNVKNGKEAIERFKTGKTQEQKKIIDFFMSGVEGCLNGGSIFSSMKIEEYEGMISNRLSQMNLKEKAIEKIGLDESEISEISPVVLSGYIWEDFDHDDWDDIVLIQTKNERVVSSRYSVSWLFFSQKQMYCYTYTFDMISDRIWEESMEFFYQDITCLKINNSLVQKIEDKNQMGCGCLKTGKKAESYSYYVDELEIVVPGRSFSFAMRNNSKLAKSLLAARNMVREKKYS